MLVYRRWVAASAAALVAALAPGDAGAQRPDAEGIQQTRVGIGYVANVPNMFLGGSVYVLPAALPGWGLYADAKLDVESPADSEEFIDSLTALEVEAELGDQLVERDGSWRSINVAVMRQITAEMWLYVGGGVAVRKEYVNYFDTERELGVAGIYWVEDTEVSGTYLNGMAGLVLRLSPKVSASFGAESAPPGVTVGLSFTLDR